MAIVFDAEKRIFKLDTKHTSYLMGLTAEGYLGHIYYGKKLQHADGAWLMRTVDVPTPSVRAREAATFHSLFPFEYPAGGVGDFRETALEVVNEAGARGCELFFERYEIVGGKPAFADYAESGDEMALFALPQSFAGKEEKADPGCAVRTLVITLTDPVLSLEVKLLYTVFEEEDVITRAALIRNRSEEKTLRIEKALSACIEMDDEDFEVLSLPGCWARERQIMRTPLTQGSRFVHGSTRGKEGAEAQPFLALLDRTADYTHGSVYGMNLVYSGNCVGVADRSNADTDRLVMGIHPDGFAWELQPGRAFVTPEAVLTYSAAGLGQMSRNYHDFYRNHLIRSPYLHQKRPILINNWEATYFQFDTEKLLAIAREAKKAGIEMLVMDDGWFGHRDSDNSSLGDWFVNEEKLPGGLPYLVEEVEKIGLKFGIWMEPEMISEDSEVYRAHPDWALQIAGRRPTQAREQLVMDLVNPDAFAYVWEWIRKTLSAAHISYLKWDMNRVLTDVASAVLPAHRQGEYLHRFALAVYALQERLVQEFPDVLLENCSSGGARFDPGMLYYSPQIWTSDNAEAIDRLAIQEGTALLYPLSTMGAHVAAVPSHTNGRVTPFATRGAVALSGTFGYELDITKLPEKEKAEIAKQCAVYHQVNDLVREGDYYRLASFRETGYYDCYMVVSKDQKDALLTYVQVRTHANWWREKIRLQGLKPDAAYTISEISLTEGEMGGTIGGAAERGAQQGYNLADGSLTAAGDILMEAGLLLPNLPGDSLVKLYRLKMH